MLEYATLARRGSPLGVTLFLTGAAAGIVGPAVFGPLPAVGMRLLFDAEPLGLLVGSVSPLAFGVLLALTGRSRSALARDARASGARIRVRDG